MTALPRRTPCATCPYRQSVPSGIWAPEEYAKLPRYDEPTWAQPTQAFMCHQRDETVCAGWLGHADPAQLLAVRIGVVDGRLDPACLDYQTDVPLHPSGAAAARHGLADLEQPSGRALDAIAKLTRQGLDA